MTNKINVHVCVAYNAIPYFQKMINNYESLKSINDTLIWHIYAVDQNTLALFKQNGFNTYFTPGAKGSEAHSNAFKVAMQNARNTDGVCDIMADGDTMMVYKNWTSKLKEIIEQTGILASQFERINSVCSGPGLIQMYKLLPSLTWFCLNKQYDLSTIEVSVHKQDHLLIDTEEKSKLYNLPIGYSLLRDSLWQLPEIIKKFQIPFQCLEMLKPQQDAVKVLTNRNNYNEEFHLPKTNIPWVVHCRGASGKTIDHILPTQFYEDVENYLKSL